MRYQKARIIPPKNAAHEPELIDAVTVDLEPAQLRNAPREYVKATDATGIPTYISQWDCLNGWHTVYVRLDS